MKRYSRKSKSYSSKNKKKLSRKNKSRSRNNKSRSKNNMKNNQKGGSDCSLATVKEPAFSVASLGNIKGLDIPESRAAIYHPNCQTDSYQAMIP